VAENCELWQAGKCKPPFFGGAHDCSYPAADYESCAVYLDVAVRAAGGTTEDALRASGAFAPGVDIFGAGGRILSDKDLREIAGSPSKRRELVRAAVAREDPHVGSIVTRCANLKCKARYQVSKQYVGRSASCRQCGTKFTVQEDVAEGRGDLGGVGKQGHCAVRVRVNEATAMAKLKTTCRACGTTLTVDEIHLGKTGRCKQCGAEFPIKRPEARPAEVTQPEVPRSAAQVKAKAADATQPSGARTHEYGEGRSVNAAQSCNGAEQARRCLRCHHCGKPNVPSFWPTRGDSVPFGCQALPARGKEGETFSLPIVCPSCRNIWYVVWDQNIDPIADLLIRHVDRMSQGMTAKPATVEALRGLVCDEIMGKQVAFAWGAVREACGGHVLREKRFAACGYINTFTVVPSSQASTIRRFMGGSYLTCMEKLRKQWAPPECMFAHWVLGIDKETVSVHLTLLPRIGETRPVTLLLPTDLLLPAERGSLGL
jgi:DNA-directed RNA polymerase subunit M/transcription elongation factor TFIIS